MSLSRCVFFAVLASLLNMPFAAYAQPGTDADIVIMLDLSGSINYTGTPTNDLENEKNAARSLLSFFAQAPVKPRVAIGTFNACEPDPLEPECDNLQARILPNASLTAIYGNQNAGTGLFGALNTLTRTKGFTDLQQAIDAARQHLASQNNTARKYIILISDGVPNRPGGPDEDTYGDCGGCGCQTAYDSASAAAKAASDQGIAIFTVHYTGHDSNVVCPSEPAAGLAFLGTKLAETSGFAYDGDAGLTDAFEQITFAITCDDGDPCTMGVINMTTHACDQLPAAADADGDGVVDCQDKCSGNDALLGTACQVGTGACSVTGTQTCGAANSLVCTGTPVDNVTCFGCTNYPISNDLSVLGKHFVEEAAGLKKLAAELGKVASDKKTKKLSTQSARQSKVLKNTSANTLATLPSTMQGCTNAAACIRIGNEATFGLLSGSSQQAMVAAQKLSQKLRKLHKQTKKDTKLLRRIKFLNTDVATVLDGLPRFQSSCSVK